MNCNCIVTIILSGWKVLYYINSIALQICSMRTQSGAVCYRRITKHDESDYEVSAWDVHYYEGQSVSNASYFFSS